MYFARYQLLCPRHEGQIVQVRRGTDHASPQSDAQAQTMPQEGRRQMRVELGDEGEDRHDDLLCLSLPLIDVKSYRWAGSDLYRVD